MMDTDILFRDGRRFRNNFSNGPSSMTSDSADSISSSDGVEAETFPSKICSWNYDSGFDNDFELMLNRFDFDTLAVNDFPITNDWGSREVKEEDIEVDEKPFLLTLQEIKKETDVLINIVENTNSTKIDSHSDVEQNKKDLPDLDEIVANSFLECPEFPAVEFSNNFVINDLPPNLDLCDFINEEETSLPSDIKPTVKSFIDIEDQKLFNNGGKVDEKSPLKPQFGAGRKKIDLKAQRYIVDHDFEEEEDENIDVETISENGNNPVLEARDLDSLLEQFEATEVEVKEFASVTGEKDLKEQKAGDNLKSSSKFKISENHQSKYSTMNVFNNIDTKVGTLPNLAERNVDVEQKYVTNVNKQTKTKKENLKPSNSINSNSALCNNKQIIEALPQELIDRIKECGKRKRVEIIDPVPNHPVKKKKVQDSSPLPHPVQQAARLDITSSLVSIGLDHNYCAVKPPQKKSSHKDSGYISATEEDDKVLHNQPIVKNADGKLMISLLKVNTIRPNNLENQKKKLNIEEYKKRRFGVLNTPISSLSNSPANSNCSSPLPEDEHTKRLKHEEKLRKMALELLNTPPKSSTISVVQPAVKKEILVPVEKPVVSSPSNMLKITYVSIGVNTDITGRNPLTPAEKLEEIKPLLKNASVRINSNSLINSLIENIPRAIKSDTPVPMPEPVKEVHGEDKTIIFLPKNRKPPKTSSVEVQTSITLLGDNKRRYRRRKDSSTSSISSSSSQSEHRTRSGSKDSRYSKSARSSRSTSVCSSSSRSSVGTSSRSISRSPSPHRVHRKRRGFNKEYVQEVEERRVVYVGKIAPKTTKKDLYRRFSRFGPIKTISLHFRDHGDNYGFVTFANKLDAYAAIEHGNDDPYDVHYDLSFGGRRLFCKTSYSDLDNMRDDYGYNTFECSTKPTNDESFDRLLQEMQEKLKRRKL